MPTVKVVEGTDREEFEREVARTVEEIGVEIAAGAEALTSFDHPQRAVYLLGAEDRGLSNEALAELDTVVSIPAGSLNVAVAGSVVMYDRFLKRC